MGDFRKIRPPGFESELERLERGLYAEPEVGSLALNRYSASLSLPDFNLPKVFGEITERAKENVKWAYKEAKGGIIKYLGAEAIKPYLKALKDVNIYIDKRGISKEGLTAASTNGDEIDLNEAVVPETNLYSRIMEKLYENRDKNFFTRYLYDKLSKGYENMVETIKHELIHVYQINSGLVDKIVKATEKYIDENIELPDWVKPYKKVLAFKVAVPAIEGLTEATRHEIEGYSPQETKAMISGNPTTYAGDEGITIDALGGNRPSDLQRKSLSDYGKSVKNYIKNFMNLKFFKPQASYA